MREFFNVVCGGQIKHFFLFGSVAKKFARGAKSFYVQSDGRARHSGITTTAIVFTLIVSTLISLFAADKTGRAQNYDKVWTLTDDFNTGANSNIDTTGDEAKLATTTTVFSEEFANETYKDDASDANWDTSSNKLTLPGDPTSGISTALQTKWKSTVGANEAAQKMIYDATNHLLYIGGASGSFGAYNPATGDIYNLTNKISADWSSTAIGAMEFDSINGIIYLGGGSGKFGAFRGGSDPENGIWNYLNSKISASWGVNDIQSFAFDSANGYIYLAGSATNLGAFIGDADPSSGTFVYLNSKISTDWGTNAVKALTYDPSNNFIYLGGSNSRFGSYLGGADPANGTWTNLSAKMNWGINYVTALTYDSTNHKIYATGETGRFGCFTGGGDPTNGTFTGLDAKYQAAFGLAIGRSLTFETTNSTIYVGTANGKFGSFAGGSNPSGASVINLTARISGDWGAAEIFHLASNPDNGKVYLASNTIGKFGSYSGGADPANGSWTNESLSVAGTLIGYDILSSSHDSTNGFLYLGGASGKFAAYHLSNNSAVDLTPKISSAWSTNAIYGMTYDSQNGYIYIGGSGPRIGAFPVDTSPSDNTFVNLTSVINLPYTARSLAFDSINGRVCIASGDTWPSFGVFTGGSNPAVGTYHSYSVTTPFGATRANAVTFDSANAIIYVASSGGAFRSFTSTADPASSVATDLTSKISGSWGANAVNSMVFDPTNSRVYLGGNNGKLGTFNGGASPSEGIFTYLTTQLSSPDFDNASNWSNTNITALSYASGKILIGGASGKFGIFNTAADVTTITSWYYLYSSISSINGTNQINTIAYTPSISTAYLGAATGKLTSFFQGYATNKWGISNTIDETALPIGKATLTATATIPENTAITYYLSNNGGSDWHEVSSGAEYAFSVVGSDLRWKAYLTTSNPTITPEVSELQVSYKFFASADGTLSLVYNALEPVVPSHLSWTNTLPSNTVLTLKLRSATTSEGLSAAIWSDNIPSTASSPFNLQTLNVGETTGVLENQYIEILITFETNDNLDTPVLSDITLEYVINESPELQMITASQATDGSKNVNITFQLRDADTTLNPYNQNKVSISYQYSVDSGETWENCETITNSGLQSVNADGSWKNMTAIWYAGTDIPNEYLNGTVRIKVLANDNEQAHNTADSTSELTSLDTKNPVLGTITQEYAGVKVGTTGNWTNDSTPNLSLLATDDTALQMEIRNDNNFSGAKVPYATSYDDWPLTNGDGTKSIYVRFYDAYGNYTEASQSILLDTTPPAIPGHFTLFDTSNEETGTYSITAIWDVVNNPGDFNKYSLERSTNGTDFTELATFSNLAADVYADKDLSPEITYYYRLRCEDIHNNFSGYTEIKELRPAGSDTVPPEITGPGPTSQAFATTANITWMTSEPADSYVEFGTTISYGNNQGSDELVANHSVTVIGLQPTTTYHYRVKSRDANGNKVTSADYTFTTTLPEDSQSTLSITGATAQKPGANPEEVTIIWTTDKYASSQVLYGKTEDLGQQTDEDATLNKTHYVTIGGLEPNTKYYYKARSRDTYGNIVDGETKFFVTAQSDEGNANAAINFVEISDITMNSAIISWQTVTVATSVVEIGSAEGYSGRIEDISTGSTTQHVVRLKDLTQGTQYHFRVMGQTGAGAWVASDNYKFSTVPTPVISQIAIKNVASTSATISWKTNVPTDSTVDYGAGELSLSQGSSANVTEHEVNLTALNPATKYQYSIRIRDSYGNSITSPPSEFHTIVDTTGPIIRDMKSETSIITDQNGTSKAQAIISWSTDEPSTAQVKYSMGVVSGSDYPLSTAEDTNLSTSHVIIISNLQPSATYHMKLVSKDSSGNISASDDYTVLTLNQDKSLLQYIVQILEERFSWLKSFGLF